MRLNSYASPLCALYVMRTALSLIVMPALALEVERVEHLRLHLALLQHAGGFDQAVGQGGLAVVDVGDDAEIADVIELQSRLSGTRRAGRTTHAIGI